MKKTKPTPPTRIRKSVSLTPEVVALVENAAAKIDRKFSYVVNQVLAREFGNQ